MSTSDDYRKAVQLLVTVALDAPIRQGAYTFRGGIRWTTIDEIRAEVERLGIDWKKHHRSSKK